MNTVIANLHLQPLDIRNLQKGSISIRTSFFFISILSQIVNQLNYVVLMYFKTCCGLHGCLWTSPVCDFCPADCMQPGQCLANCGVSRLLVKVKVKVKYTCICIAI